MLSFIKIAQKRLRLFFCISMEKMIYYKKGFKGEKNCTVYLWGYRL